MRYKYLKLIAIILAAAIVAVAIVLLTQNRTNQFNSSYKSGVSYPTTPLSLTLWLPSNEKGNFDTIIASYRKLHPNVTIKTEYIETGQYTERLFQATQTNTLPDMFVVRDENLAGVKPYISPAPASVMTIEDFENTYVEFAQAQLTSGSTVYAAPLGVATLGLVYNQDRAQQAGVTKPPNNWNEFESTNEKLRKKDGQNLQQSGVALGSANINNYPDIISVLMMQNGAVMNNKPPTQATFNQPDRSGYPSAAKAVMFYASFSQSNRENYSWNDNLGDSITALSQNKTAMIIDYPMVYKQVRKLNSNMLLSTAALPQTNTSASINYATVLSGVVSKNSPQTEIAWDFWGFAVSAAEQKAFSTQSYWPASRKDLANAQLNDQDLSPFIKQQSTAQSWYKGVNQATNSELVDMLNKYLSGLDAQIVVNNAATKITNIIQTTNK